MAADTKLQEAVRYGDSNVVESALEDGADANAMGIYGWSPMHEAASNGDTDILELLIQYKGDPNIQDEVEGCTPVHYAAKEGSTDCLRVLLKAGGRYDIMNSEGKSPLDEACDECHPILDKERTKDYLNMTMDAARISVTQSQQAKLEEPKSKSRSKGQRSDLRSMTPDDLDGAKEAGGRITIPRAWNSIKVLETQKASEKDSITGTLQLSFEYNSKAKTFKIRVWALQDILLPPAEFSNLSRIYIRSHILPDKKGETKRKSDEIRIDDPTKMTNSLVTLRRKGMRESFKAVFLPSTFKFSKALEYQGITPDMVASRMVHIAVCVRQRYSTKTIPVANLQFPMKEAVRKLLKEKHQLQSCINYSMPDNIHAYNPQEIVVISEGMYSNVTTSHPTLRSKSRQTLMTEEDDPRRATSDINLKAVRCHSVESVPSTTVDVDSLNKETALDDLLEVSVRSSEANVFDPSQQNITVVEVHEAATPPATPLPGFAEDGELTDISIVSSSPRQSPDSLTIDMDGLETIALSSSLSPAVTSSTPAKDKHKKRVQHGFANPHVTIVDDGDDEEPLEVTIDKLDPRKWAKDKKDAVIDIGHVDHGEDTKKKGLRGHLFRKRDKHKKEKADGLDNPGYVVDMRTGRRSLLGEFGEDTDKKRAGNLEMLEILSDEELDARFAKKPKDVKSKDKSRVMVDINNISKDAVIEVVGSGDVPETRRGKKTYNVQGAVKKDEASRVRRKQPESSVTKESGRHNDIDNKEVEGTVSPRVVSPVPVIHVECVDEVDRSLSPGNRPPRSPRSPRQARKVSPTLGVSAAGKTSTQQDFPPPITRGLPHTDLIHPCDKSGVKPIGSETQNVGSVNVTYVSETDDTKSFSPKLGTKTSSREKKIRGRSKSPGWRRENGQEGAPQFEMMTLWNDEEWRKKLATPEFKLQMFQRKSEDPHPSTPILKKYQSGDPAVAAVNPAFVPETPPSKADMDTPSRRVEGARAKRKTHRTGADLEKSKSGERVEMKNSLSITTISQSSL